MLHRKKNHPRLTSHPQSCSNRSWGLPWVRLTLQILMAGWLALGTLGTARLLADITMPSYFSDGMVLQRNSEIEIWGKANPGQKLTVQFLEQQVPVVSDARGQWSATIKTFQAGGPFELTVVAEGAGPKKVLTDVMVGEVWLCSGQSNMEWPINRSLGTEAAILSAKDYPNIKFFNVAHDAAPQPLDDFARVRPWRTCNGETVADFSAVAFYFGRELSDSLGHIPIGLISSTWGGTPAEAWVSRGGMEQVDSLGPLLQHWDDRTSNDNQYRPGYLYNGMIAPLSRARIGGVIWYQGESNNGRGAQYATLFPTLINDWRKTFSSPELPFLFVQLAPFRYGNRSPHALAEVWEAQLKTWKQLPKTGMVVTTDIADLADIHPGNKLDVGRRLALLARGIVYQPAADGGEKLLYSGPIFKSYQIDQNTIVIDFDFTGDGLIIQGQGETLNQFQICGSDGQFVPAIATLRGEQVVVSSPDVAAPVAVRFGWSDTAQPNLFNAVGATPHLPASPFRTDDFPLESEGINF